MSYDLMVFEKDSAPATKPEFLEWYEAQTEWTENHDYTDPAVTSSGLRNWFMEMIRLFPPMNGPFAHGNPDDENVTDYSIGRSVVYAAFTWSVVAAAYQTALALAEKHGVGFFNTTAENGEILR